MGTGYAQRDDEMIAVTPVTLEAENGILRVRGGGWVKIVKGQWIHVGCHRISKDAWELLKKMVDGK